MQRDLVRHLLGAARAATRLTRRRPAGTSVRLRFAFPELGAPTRYRVYHHVEQARIAGLLAEAIPLTDERVYDLSRSDLLYLYRMPLAPRSLALLLAARMRRIPVLFDCDDLVWDARAREFEMLDRYHERGTITRILRTARGVRALMRRVDALVLSTPYLAAQAALECDRPVYTHLNAVSREMVALSDAAYQRRAPGKQIVIGYFSGHPHVHDDDLASVAVALRSVLDQFQTVIVLLYGDVELPAELAAGRLAGRIEQRPRVDWRLLPDAIAQVDIAIAPLIDNPQRRSKSAVKYLEAALCGVPTVASRLEPYTAVIREGQHALLAHTSADWTAALSMLVENRLLREQLGARARAHVLAEHTTDARAPAFAQLLERVLAAK
jgi:glycosyltransferase involved in cell wall biosynthesis